MLQHFLSVLPGGTNINYFLQRFVTRNFPLSENGFRERVKSTSSFYDWYIRYSTSLPSESICFEFSSGAHLQNPIGLRLLGFKKIYTADVADIARPFLVQDIIDRYRPLPDCKMPDPPPVLSKDNLRKVLEEVFNIVYLAPVRITALDIPGGSMDFINSRTTFEHIPAKDIPALLDFCHRLLRKDGLAIFSIDYRDHWSFFDSGISVYHFLQFSENSWRKYNPQIHYQNRLRHIDYMHLFKQHGFDIVYDETQYPEPEQEQLFNQLEIDPYFMNNYAPEQLRIVRGDFILRK
jgi:SAM-dependent methyltransferase